MWAAGLAELNLTQAQFFNAEFRALCMQMQCPAIQHTKQANKESLKQNDVQKADDACDQSKCQQCIDWQHQIEGVTTNQTTLLGDQNRAVFRRLYPALIEQSPCQNAGAAFVFLLLGMAPLAFEFAKVDPKAF